jgi:hypothetical protein
MDTVMFGGGGGGALLLLQPSSTVARIEAESKKIGTSVLFKGPSFDKQ